MKLIKPPENLPIEAVHEVTRLLDLLILTLKDENILFKDAHDRTDYAETLSCLREDLDSYYQTYEDWVLEANVPDLKTALANMQRKLIEAATHLKKIEIKTIH